MSSIGRRDIARERINEVLETKAKVLDLRLCGITDLNNYPELFSMTWLEELAIGNSEAEVLGFKYVPGVNEYNVFNIIPKEILNLHRLITLDLGQLSLLGEARVYLPRSINKLSLNGTQIGNPERLVSIEIIQLEELHISGCGLGEDARFIAESCTNLTILDISYNEIGDRAGALLIERLRKLTHIDLSDTNIGKETLRALAKSGLYYSDIALRYNNISDEILREIKGLRVALSINLSNNPISDLNLLQGTDPYYLILAHTNITEIKPLKDFDKTENIILEGNNIEDCPADIWQTGDVRQIRAYFLSQQRTKSSIKIPASSNEPDLSQTDEFDEVATPRRDVKLILLGNSAAGKTNFVHYLKTGEYLAKRDSTHGLNVEYWVPGTEGHPMLENIGVSIWDFGGQEYYHDAYRLFLSANAVYVLLWSEDTNTNGYSDIVLRDDQEPKQLAHYHLEYWLDTIRAKRGKNAPLFVVQNKTDLHGKIRLDQTLHNEYGIDESFHISLKEAGKGENSLEQKQVQMLLEHLYDQLGSTADQAEYNNEWLNLREELREFAREDGKKFYTLDPDRYGGVELMDFLDVCSHIMQIEIGDDEAYTLPRWLDRCGVITFNDSESLRSKVFLNPVLLTRMLYSDLDSDLLDRKGYYVPGTEDSNINTIELLKTLDMVVELREAGNSELSYIVPQYLPETHAIEDLFKIASDKKWPHTIWLLVPTFAYRKMLTSVIAKYFKDGQIEARYFWKHGILFKREGSLVLIKGLPDEGGSHCAVLQVSLEQGQKNADQGAAKAVFQDLLDLYESCHLPHTEERTIMQSSMNKIDYEGEKRAKLTAKALNRMFLSYDGQHFAKYIEIVNKIRDGKTVIESSIVLNSSDLVEANAVRDIQLHPFGEFLNFPVNKAKRVFISYSHNNTHWLNRLQVHLAGLRHSDLISQWTDQMIIPGERWDERIRDEIAKADVFIVLLSADFIASHYIWNEELPAIRKRLESNHKHFIPVLIEPFDIGAVGQISVHEIIPKTSDEKLKPVSLWENAEDGLAVVAQKIRAALKSREPNI